MTDKKPIGHWSFSVSHFSFFRTYNPEFREHLRVEQIEDRRPLLKMTNEKWKMPNDQ